MSEQYVESIIIRKDNQPETDGPSFADGDCDSLFEFEGTLRLVQIIKSVQNATHNKHDYVFVIENITKLKKEV